MSGYFSKEVCVAECPDISERNTTMEGEDFDDIDRQLEAGTELERLNEEMKFRRHPDPIIVTVSGNRADLNDWFPKLYSWLHNQSANVDFSLDNSGLEFKVYPFAVND